MYKSGLVLEGGGSRGVYTGGVLDAFIENGIEFPYVIGVSMGSCNGASFLGKSLHRQHDIIINYVNDKRYMGLEHMIKGGEFLNSDWIFGELSYEICPLDHDTFDNSGATYCVVTTNAKTGKPEYFYPKTLRPWGCPEIRASCSMPLVTKGYEIGGEVYFDGGIVDSIPLKRAIEDGCEKAVVILTQHKGFEKKPLNPKVGKLIKDYPLVAKAMLERHEMYNAQLEYVKKMQEEGRAYVIQPMTPLNCNALEKNTEKLESIYRLGYTEGQKKAKEVIEFLNK